MEIFYRLSFLTLLTSNDTHRSYVIIIHIGRLFTFKKYMYIRLACRVVFLRVAQFVAGIGLLYLSEIGSVYFSTHMVNKINKLYSYVEYPK